MTCRLEVEVTLIYDTRKKLIQGNKQKRDYLFALPTELFRLGRKQDSNLRHNEVTLIYDTCKYLKSAVTAKQGLLFFPDEVSLFYDTLNKFYK